MGPAPPSKPQPIIQDSNLESRSDDGFKLIQFNLDANNNGDSISVATIFFIMISTVILMALLKKIYAWCMNCYKDKLTRFSYHPGDPGLNRASANVIGMNQLPRQENLERIPRVENPV